MLTSRAPPAAAPAAGGAGSGPPGSPSSYGSAEEAGSIASTNHSSYFTYSPLSLGVTTTRTSSVGGAEALADSLLGGCYSPMAAATAQEGEGAPAASERAPAAGAASGAEVGGSEGAAGGVVGQEGGGAGRTETEAAPEGGADVGLEGQQQGPVAEAAAPSGSSSAYGVGSFSASQLLAQRQLAAQQGGSSSSPRVGSGSVYTTGQGSVYASIVAQSEDGSGGETPDSAFLRSFEAALSAAGLVKAAESESATQGDESEEGWTLVDSEAAQEEVEAAEVAGVIK